MTRAFGNQNRAALTLGQNRLENPAMAGYRAGMSSSGVIGRKLGAVFNVQPDLPQEFGEALQELHSRLGRGR